MVGVDEIVLCFGAKIVAKRASKEFKREKEEKEEYKGKPASYS
jgi:hypothetical protein